MFRMWCVSILIIALTSNSLFVFAQTNSQKHERKIKELVIKQGTERRVFIVLNSKEALDGRIMEIRPESFIFQAINSGNLSERELNYSDVRKIMRTEVRTHNFSGRTAFIIGIVTGILIIVGQAAGVE